MRKEESLEKLLKTKTSFKDFEGEKNYKEMKNGEVVEAGEEEGATLTNSTMKIISTKYLEIVVVNNEEEENVELIKVPIK